MTTIASTSASTAAAASPTSTLTSAADQEDRFMKLLVAQMKNQDPLNPMDNAQMTSQIAQINTVGGIEKLNGTVESLLAAFGNLQAQSATQLPGHNVLVEGSDLTLANGLATGGVELDGAASAVNVQIVDGTGAVVQTLALGPSPAGVRSFTWDGQQADGQAGADGTWRMQVMATDASGKPVAARTLSAVRVQSVSTGSGGPQLDLGSAGVQPWSAIKSFL